ncbi:hexose transporter protein [Aspergillus pseudoustus]|uniref:Hexose transporter protein n=1 Tax=Aspergillus pseudoustus TaxID=1810923 RepID=A0ABR4JF61_9EURO
MADTPESERHAAPDFRKISNNTNKDWWLDPSLRRNIFHCIGLCGTLFFNGYDGSLLNGLQSIDRWQEYFDHPSSTTLGLMNSAGFLPGIIASFTSDRISFYFGRRASVWTGSIITTVGAIVMSVSTSTAIFCGGRVLLGFGTSVALTVAPALLQEIAHPRLRAQLGAFYTAVYYIAAVISAGTCLGCIDLIDHWAGYYSGNNRDDARWLAKNGKLDEARRILVKYHANGAEDDQLVALEMAEIEQALEFEDQNRQVRYTDLLKGKANLQRLAINLTVAVGTNWVGNGIVSYYLSPILTSLGIGDPKTQLKILMGLQTWNLIIASTAAFLVERAGRRPLWLSSTGGMFITFAIIMSLSAGYSETGTLAMGVAAIPFLFLFYGSYSIAWTPLAYSYPVEILPYSLRTKGQAIYITTQTLAVSLNTWVNPVALEALQWKYYAVYIALQLVFFVIIWFIFPETKGLTIEEIGALFDKDSSFSGHHYDSAMADNAEVGSILNDTSMDKE